MVVPGSIPKMMRSVINLFVIFGNLLLNLKNMKFVLLSSITCFICFVLSSQSLKAQETYCNPMNLDYGFTPIPNFSEQGRHRATADPVITFFKDRYYLFSTNLRQAEGKAEAMRMEAAGRNDSAKTMTDTFARQFALACVGFSRGGCCGCSGLCLAFETQHCVCHRHGGHRVYGGRRVQASTTP